MFTYLELGISIETYRWQEDMKDSVTVSVTRVSCKLQKNQEFGAPDQPQAIASAKSH